MWHHVMQPDGFVASSCHWHALFVRLNDMYVLLPRLNSWVERHAS